MEAKHHMASVLEERGWRDTPLGWMHQDLDGEFYALKDAYEYQLEMDKI